MTQTLQQRSKAEANLVRKAWADDQFRAELLENPTAAYATALEAVGGSLDEGTDVRVLQESSNDLYLVIPSGDLGVEAPELGERSTRADLETSIIVEATSDSDAKVALLNDPRAAYEAKLGSIRNGAKLPESMKVSAVVESDNVIYLRLPEAPASESGELSEEELEQAAGGAVAVGIAIASTVVVGAVAVAALLLHEEHMDIAH